MVTYSLGAGCGTKVPSRIRLSPLLEVVSTQYKSYTMKQLHTMTKLYSEKVIQLRSNHTAKKNVQYLQTAVTVRVSF